MLYLNQRLLYLHSLLQRRPMLLPGSSGSYHADTGLHQWILNSGTEKLGLKLGGAKPLGLGSISCEVERVMERKVLVKDGKVEYQQAPVPVDRITYDEAGLSSTVKAEFYKIAGLETIPVGVKITYPRELAQKDKPMEEGFKWFMNNHKTISGKDMATGRMDVKIVDVLPAILDDDISMRYN